MCTLKKNIYPEIDICPEINIPWKGICLEIDIYLIHMPEIELYPVYPEINIYPETNIFSEMNIYPEISLYPEINIHP